MVNGTKKTPTKKTLSRKKIVKTAPLTRSQRMKANVASFYKAVLKSRKDFLSRRTHRSFVRTRRRDYVRSMSLPGYISLTMQVNRTLRAHYRTFLLLALVYTLLIIVVGGITSQDTYAQIQDLFVNSSKDISSGEVDQIATAGLTALAAFASLPLSLTSDQQIYLGIILGFAWLSTVWLLREYLLGRSPKLRDGLYNSGSPFISTMMVTTFILIQLVPIGILAVIYGGLASAGIIGEGFSSMLFWGFAVLVLTLVLYWVTSSLFALVIVTLPGMYPYRAIRMASDIVLGRRLRILIRFIWGILVILLVWAVVIIPSTLLTSFAASAWPIVGSIPIVPYIGAALTAASVIWYAAYVYIFYRKFVDNA